VDAKAFTLIEDNAVRPFPLLERAHFLIYFALPCPTLPRLTPERSHDSLLLGYQSNTENAMPFQRVPNSAQIAVRGSRGGQNIVMTFHAQKSSGYNLADLEALAAAVDTWVDTSLLPEMGNDYSYVGTTVRGLDEEFDQIAENNDNAGPGIAGGSTAPNNVSFAIKRRSAFTGRGARGRVYLPPPPAGAFEDDNHVTQAWADALTVILNDFRDAIDTVNWVEVIVHRVSEGASLPVAIVFTVVEYVVVDLVMDSMRRRLPGRGT